MMIPLNKASGRAGGELLALALYGTGGVLVVGSQNFFVTSFHFHEIRHSFIQ
jgi:hypothetical protein